MMKVNITISQLMITRKKEYSEVLQPKKKRKPSIIFESIGLEISEYVGGEIKAVNFEGMFTIIVEK